MGTARFLARIVVRGVFKLLGLDSPYSAKGYGLNWSTQRQGCLKRDEYTCRVCGVDQEELDRELAVHHIRPRTTFNDDNWREMNDLSNLVSLCPSCHGHFEGEFTGSNPEEFVRRARQKL